MICSKCKRDLPIEEFYSRERTRPGQHFTTCKGCYHQMSANIARQNKDKVLEIYGNKCACCGETKKEFLSIDHINGGGHKERQEIFGQNFYRYLLKLPEKRTDLRVLCMNCNFSLGKYGYCPHERERENE